MRHSSQLVAIWQNGENTWTRLCALAHRVFPQRPQRRLRISETLALGDKRQLMIVQCGERQLLIGAAGNFLGTLAELSSEKDSAENKERS